MLDTFLICHPGKQVRKSEWTGLRAFKKQLITLKTILKKRLILKRWRNRPVRQVFSFKGYLRLFVESVLVNIFVTDGFQGQQKFFPAAMQKSLMWHSDSAMKLQKVLPEPLPVFMELLQRKQKGEDE